MSIVIIKEQIILIRVNSLLNTKYTTSTGVKRKYNIIKSFFIVIRNIEYSLERPAK